MTGPKDFKRDLTDAELHQVAGGQSPEPTTRITIEIDSGTCQNVSIGDHVQQICGKAVESTIPQIKSQIDAVIGTVLAVCAICGITLGYRAYLRNTNRPPDRIPL